MRDDVSPSFPPSSSYSSPSHSPHPHATPLALPGQQEGGFAWLTLNYLLGKIGSGPDDTVAAIDLGGGSVQEAFALTPEDAKLAPEGYVLNLKGAGKTYSVYVHR